MGVRVGVIFYVFFLFFFSEHVISSLEDMGRSGVVGMKGDGKGGFVKGAGRVWSLRVLERWCAKWWELICSTGHSTLLRYCVGHPRLSSALHVFIAFFE